MAKMQSDHGTDPAVADVTEFCDAERGVFHLSFPDWASLPLGLCPILLSSSIVQTRSR